MFLNQYLHADLSEIDKNQSFKNESSWISLLPLLMYISQSINGLLTQSKWCLGVSPVYWVTGWSVIDEGSDYLLLTAVMFVELGSFFSFKQSSAVSRVLPGVCQCDSSTCFRLIDELTSARLRWNVSAAWSSRLRSVLVVQQVSTCHF